MRIIIGLMILFWMMPPLSAQNIVRLPDTRLNTGAASANGVAQPKLARGPEGRLAATWLDRTTQGTLSTEHGPIFSIRTYTWNGTTLTPVVTPSFFGPNPSAKWYYSSFRHHDTAYRPDGILLAFLEHYGEQSAVLTSRYTAEINVFALNASHQLLDLNGSTAACDPRRHRLLPHLGGQPERRRGSLHENYVTCHGYLNRSLP